MVIFFFSFGKQTRFGSLFCYSAHSVRSIVAFIIYLYSIFGLHEWFFFSRERKKRVVYCNYQFLFNNRAKFIASHTACTLARQFVRSRPFI